MEYIQNNTACMEILITQELLLDIMSVWNYHSWDEMESEGKKSFCQCCRLQTFPTKKNSLIYFVHDTTDTFSSLHVIICTNTARFA